MTKPLPPAAWGEKQERPELQMAQAAVSPRLPTWSYALRAVSWELSPAGVRLSPDDPQEASPRQGGLRATQKTRQ